MMEDVNVINLPPNSWLITLGNDAVSDTQWFQLLTSWALSSSVNQASLGRQNSILLSPCITSILVTMDTLFTSSLGNGRSGWGRKLKTYILVTLLWFARIFLASKDRSVYCKSCIILKFHVAAHNSDFK